jgi:hypothetical protein
VQSHGFFGPVLDRLCGRRYLRYLLIFEELELEHRLDLINRRAKKMLFDEQ